MNTETIKPIESPEKLIPERMLCWTCKSAVRAMVFFPNDGGGYLSVNCSRCSAAERVLTRLEKQR